METSQELDIKRYLRLVYQKRFIFVVIMATVTSLFVALAYLLPKKFEASSTVLVERTFLNDVMKGIMIATPSVDERVKAVAAILKSRPVILKVVKDLELDLTRKTDAELESLIQSFEKDTDVKFELNRSNRRDMDTFTVSVQHRNPVIARDYVNTLIRRYVEESMSSKREDTYGASKFLTEQISIFKEKINTIDGTIAKMRQQKDLAAQEGLSALQKKLDALLLQYTDQHPEVIKVKDEMASLKRQMRGRKNALGKSPVVEERPGGASTVDGGAAAEPDNAKRLQEGEPSSSTRQKIAELERDRDTYRKIYEEMVAAQGRSEVSSHIEGQDKGGTFTILEPAVLPVHPVSPNRVKMILLGLAAGIGIGVGAIILLDSMDKSVKTTDALKDFGLPVLAVIPHIELPGDVEKAKRKDRLLYAVAAVYLACVSALLAIEVIKQIS